jgi:hypothetical protein
VRVFGLFGAPIGLRSSAKADCDKLRKMGKALGGAFLQFPVRSGQFLVSRTPFRGHFETLFEIY